MHKFKGGFYMQKYNMQEFKKFYETSEEGEGQIIEYVYKGNKGKICI